MRAVEFEPPASFAGPPPLYASEQLEPEKRVKMKTKILGYGLFGIHSLLKRSKKLIFTCKLSWTRSASLLAKADSKMLECSRRVLWDCAKPANFPFSCSSSSANFLLASSNFLIRFLKHRDSWSCEKYNLVYINWMTAAQKCHEMIRDYVLRDKGDSPLQKPELSNRERHKFTCSPHLRAPGPSPGTPPAPWRSGWSPPAAPSPASSCCWSQLAAQPEGPLSSPGWQIEELRCIYVFPLTQQAQITCTEIETQVYQQFIGWKFVLLKT